MHSPLTTAVTVQKHGKLSQSSLLSPPYPLEKQMPFGGLRDGGWPAAVTWWEGEEVAQKCASPQTSCFCCDQQSKFPNRMGKSQLMQCLLSFQVFLLNRTKEGAPEKHPAGEEASGEEDTQVWAKAMRPLKQPNKALETLWVSVERRHVKIKHQWQVCESTLPRETVRAETYGWERPRGVWLVWMTVNMSLRSKKCRTCSLKASETYTNRASALYWGWRKDAVATPFAAGKGSGLKRDFQGVRPVLERRKSELIPKKQGWCLLRAGHWLVGNL